MKLKDMSKEQLIKELKTQKRRANSYKGKYYKIKNGTPTIVQAKLKKGLQGKSPYQLIMDMDLWPIHKRLLQVLLPEEAHNSPSTKIFHLPEGVTLVNIQIIHEPALSNMGTISIGMPEENKPLWERFEFKEKESFLKRMYNKIFNRTKDKDDEDI